MFYLGDPAPRAQLPERLQETFVLHFYEPGELIPTTQEHSCTPLRAVSFKINVNICNKKLKLVKVGVTLYAVEILHWSIDAQLRQ